MVSRHTPNVVLSLSFPTPISFVNSCQNQVFSLPKTLMKYVWMNPKSAKSYQKLIKTCKLLFLKNQIIVINSLIFFQSLIDPRDNEWNCCLYDKCIHGCEHFKIDLKNLRSKLWLTNRLYIRNIQKNDMNLFYTKLFQCDVKDVVFGNLTLNSSDIKILACNVEKCIFSLTYVKDNNGMEIPFHKLFELLPKIKYLHLEGYPLIPSISRDTVNELIKIQHLKEIKELILDAVPNGFEIEAFNSFLKEHKIYAKIHFSFAEDLNDEYEKRLEAFVSEILLTKTFNYVPVCINYNGLDEKLCFTLSSAEVLPSRITPLPLSPELDFQQYLQSKCDNLLFFT